MALQTLDEQVCCAIGFWNIIINLISYFLFDFFLISYFSF